MIMQSIHLETAEIKTDIGEVPWPFGVVTIRFGGSSIAIHISEHSRPKVEQLIRDLEKTLLAVDDLIDQHEAKAA